MQALLRCVRILPSEDYKSEVMVKRSFINAAILFVLLTIFIGCVGSERDSAPQSTGLYTAQASCNECHAFPGSERCKTDTVWSPDGPRSKCYSCHLGSIRYDSAYIRAENAYLYFDATLLRRANASPATDSLHGNGSITAIFARCTYCHDYPPQIGLHENHVLSEQRQCYECHFASVMSDTGTSDQPGVGLIPVFWQRNHPVPGGKNLPFMKSEKHMNGQIDVMFAKKYQSFPIVDSVFRWNPVDNSCSNIGCHSGTENGGASTKKCYWKDITR